MRCSAVIDFSLAALGKSRTSTLLGERQHVGTGNDLSNRITRQRRHNARRRRGQRHARRRRGADVLIGGNGNDIYVVDDAGDDQ